MAASDPSYIDYEAFLDPAFSAPAFANTLVLATNNASDTPLDLSTPLSRVLFDVQEIDTHTDSLTTRGALPLLQDTRAGAEASQRVLGAVEAQVAALTESYATLQREVVQRYEVAEQVRVTAERLLETVRLGRAVARAVLLARQLEVRVAEVGGKREEVGALVRSAESVVALRGVFGRGTEGRALERVDVVRVLRSEVVAPAERTVVGRAQQVVREFSLSDLLTTGSFAQTEETKSRTVAALQALWLLSPMTEKTTSETFHPSLMLAALQDYLQTSLKSSLASLARALTQLPLLDRALLEISARCQNIGALEALLQSTKPPAHPLLEKEAETETSSTPQSDFLQPLLLALDTNSLPSFFWRSLASNMAPRMQEIMYKGGVSARTLRSNRERVREAVRECVDRGSRVVGGSSGGKSRKGEGWEREAAVMVGSVVGGIK